MAREIQRFEVSLKAFLLDKGKALFVRESDTGFWELPGGRIDVGEEWRPHAAILAREIAEELGPDLRVALGEEVVSWTRHRPTDGQFLFLMARVGQVVSGVPRLSDEHAEFTWCDRESWRQLVLPPQSGYVAGIEALWRIADSQPIPA